MVILATISGCFPLTEALLEAHPPPSNVTINTVFLVEKSGLEQAAFQGEEHFFTINPYYLEKGFCEFLSGELGDRVYQRSSGYLYVRLEDGTSKDGGNYTDGSTSFDVDPKQDKKLINTIKQYDFQPYLEGTAYTNQVDLDGKRYEGTLPSNKVMCHLTKPLNITIREVNGKRYYMLPLAPITIAGDSILMVFALFAAPFIDPRDWH